MKRYVSALAVALCLVTFKAQAATSSVHELLINGNYGSSFNANVGDNGGPFSIKADVGYLYTLHEMFQLGGEVGIGYTDGATKENIDLRLLATVNFAMNNGSIQSLFIQGNAGWTNIHKSARQFVWGVDVGVRYKIFENIMYRPTVGIDNKGGGVYFRANLLAMSLQF